MSLHSLLASHIPTVHAAWTKTQTASTVCLTWEDMSFPFLRALASLWLLYMLCHYWQQLLYPLSQWLHLRTPPSVCVKFVWTSAIKTKQKKNSIKISYQVLYQTCPGINASQWIQKEVPLDGPYYLTGCNGNTLRKQLPLDGKRKPRQLTCMLLLEGSSCTGKMPV